MRGRFPLAARSQDTCAHQEDVAKPAVRPHQRFARFMSLFLVLSLMLGLLSAWPPAQKAYADVSPGEIAYSISENSGVWTFANVQVGAVPSTATSYVSLNISYPAAFAFNYAMPLGWVLNSTSAPSGSNTISLNFNVSANGSNTAVQSFLTATSTNFTLATPGVYPADGTTVTMMLTETAMAGWMDPDGNMHVYQFVETNFYTPATWLQAYNLAQTMTFSGHNGYLATLTSIDEQMYVYESIATQPGWLGGTRMLNADGSMLNGSAGISEDLTQYITSVASAREWYWADGPEAGLVFYNTPTNDSINGPVSGVFNFFSNAWTLSNYSSYSQYIVDDRQPDNSWAGTGEFCLQFAMLGKSSWNDLTNAYASNSSGVANVGYYVEFAPLTPAEYANNNAAASEPIPVPQTVIFDVNNSLATTAGLVIADQTVWTGDTATAPSELVVGQLYPAYGNQAFLGWYEDPSDTSAFDFSTPITAANCTIDPATGVATKTLYAKWQQYYTIVVTDDGNGTGSASVGSASSVTSAAPGATVTLSATPASGYEFDYWEVISGEAALSAVSVPSATFTMPAANVVVKAHFKLIAYTLYIGTDGHGSATASHASGSVSTASLAPAAASAGGSGGSGLSVRAATSAATTGSGLSVQAVTATADTVSLGILAGDIVTHTAQANSGYVFDHWECSDESILMHPAVLSDPAKASCWCAMPARDVYLIAYFRPLATTPGTRTPNTGDNLTLPLAGLSVLLVVAGGAALSLAARKRRAA